MGTRLTVGYGKQLFPEHVGLAVSCLQARAFKLISIKETLTGSHLSGPVSEL